jgi:hypothetical protein
MARPREAQLYKLRPTPNTNGLIEVAAKRNSLQALGKREQ